jgi:hypothetical protein
MLFDSGKSIMKRGQPLFFSFALILAMIVGFFPAYAQPAFALSSGAISQISGSGNGSGAVYKDHSVEISNRNSAPLLAAAPFVSSIVPANGAVNIPLNSDVTITFSQPVVVTGSWFLLVCTSSGIHSAVVNGGPVTFILNPDTDFTYGEICGLTVFAAYVTDQTSVKMAVNYLINFSTIGPLTAIHTIQGAAHISPLNGRAVTTLPSVVTALRTTGSTRGFYLQDPSPDADPATSEGIFIFTGSTSNPADMVSVGDMVQVSGKVSEFRASSTGDVNLTVTELVEPFVITQISSGNALPAPIILGTGGLIPPNMVIEDDATGNVETSGVFDPASDGLDFYESLEGMLVQINDAVATGPTLDFTSNREISVVGDNGANASIMTNRGGIVVRSNDFNPERIILNDWIAGGPALPMVNVGATFPGAIVGVMDYSFSNYKFQVISMPAVGSDNLQQEVATAPAFDEITFATFNVGNLSPTDPQSKFDTLADLIVNHLLSPDVLAIEEIQDNTGAVDDGVVDASTTWSMLINAIQAAGGPAYEYRQIDPVDNQDGGATGANIRVGFLFRTDRGLSFVDRSGADSLTANAVVDGAAGPELFMYKGHKLFIIANHFNSKSGDQPLEGRYQPPVLSSEVQRDQQATVVKDFVQSILLLDPNANVVVLGDLNDYEFSNPVNILKSAPLYALIETLPQAERYTYVYDGNSEALDHTLVSEAIFTTLPFVYDVVHVNAEFAVQASDHDPQVTRILFNAPPTVEVCGPYTVDEGQSVTVSATATDPENDPITFAWDLNNDGIFETSGQSVAFTGADGPSDQTIVVKATDEGGLFATASATVHINNVPPTATFNAPASVDEGSPFTLSLTGPVDVPADLVGLQYAFDCGSGYGAFDASNTISCPASAAGTLNVGGQIMDKDGGVTGYTATVTINNVAPLVEPPLVSPEPSTEGETVTASATFSDPGIDTELFTCSVDFGDGSGAQPGMVIGNTCNAPSHIYSTFGLYTVTFSIMDSNGSTGVNSVAHLVIFNWTGFLLPVENAPAWNSANAGNTISIQFSIGGYKGLDIFAPNYPQLVQLDCTTAAPIGLSAPANIGSSSLTFCGGQYEYCWKTEKAWAGTCRQLIIQLVDGTFHNANFNFK